MFYKISKFKQSYFHRNFVSHIIFSQEHEISTLSVAFFPLLYFFTFLYYTEVSSASLVLASYLASLHNRHKMAATLGAVAILFRQNNVAWVAFVAGVQMAEFLQKDSKEINKIQVSPDLKDKVARFYL